MQRTMKDFLLGTCCGTTLIMMTLACLVVLISAGVLLLGDSLQPDDTNQSFGETCWEAYTSFIAPGTHTSLSLTDNHVIDFIAAVATSLLGFGWVLVGFGIIVDHVGVVMDGWRRQHAKLVVHDHTLVLGWTDKTLFLVGELAQMMHDLRCTRH